MDNFCPYILVNLIDFYIFCVPFHILILIKYGKNDRKLKRDILNFLLQHISINSEILLIS